MTSDESGDGPLADLRRWQDAGAAWRVVHRGPDAVTVSLLRCDGGEEVGRLTAGDPAWVRFLATRESSED